MATLTYKLHDSEPTYRTQILDRAGDPLDLTDVESVTFHAKSTTSSFEITREATVVDEVGIDPSDGWVDVIWETATDLSEISLSEAELKVDHGGGRISSHPNNDYLTLVIMRGAQD